MKPCLSGPNLLRNILNVLNGSFRQSLIILWLEIIGEIKALENFRKCHMM